MLMHHELELMQKYGVHDDLLEPLELRFTLEQNGLRYVLK